MTTCLESTGAAERPTSNVRQKAQNEAVYHTPFFSFKSRKQETQRESVLSFFSSRLLYMIYTFNNIFPTRVTKEEKEINQSSSSAAALRAFALRLSTCNSRFRIFAFASRSSALSRSLSSCKAEEAAEALPSYKQTKNTINIIDFF